jgi:hypothetical protein
LALTIIAAAISFVSVPDWARTIVDLPLVFFLPGYALNCALLRSRTLAASERLAYSVAYSVAVAILAGVVVQTAFALDRAVWTITLTGVTLAATIVAAVVRRDPVTDAWSRPALPSLPSVIGIGSAVAVAAVAVAVAASAAGDAHSHSHFTALSILPAGVSRGGRQPVAIAVENQTGELKQYHLSVTQGGRRLLTEAPALADAAKMSWRVDASTPSSADPVTATLRLGDRVYRRVYLRSAPQ